MYVDSNNFHISYVHDTMLLAEDAGEELGMVADTQWINRGLGMLG